MTEIEQAIEHCELIAARSACPASCAGRPQLTLLVGAIGCGVLLCDRCGYILFVPRDVDRACIPPPDRLRQFMRSNLGKALAGLQKRIRLGLPEPGELRVSTKGHSIPWEGVDP